MKSCTEGSDEIYGCCRNVAAFPVFIRPERSLRVIGRSGVILMNGTTKDNTDIRRGSAYEKIRGINGKIR